MVKSSWLILLLLGILANEAWCQLENDCESVLFRSSRDSLLLADWAINPAQPAGSHRLNWNRQTTLGAGLTVGAAIAAIYCHYQADQAYRRYLHSGSYTVMRREFRRAERFDRLTGWAYAWAEVGFLITVFSFDK